MVRGSIVQPMTRTRSVLICVLGLVLYTVTAVSARGMAQSTNHLYIVYLPGLCAWQHSDPYCYGQVNAANRAHATFGTLRAAMTRQHLARHELYFSYNQSNPAHYSVNDTHQTVARATSALE